MNNNQKATKRALLTSVMALVMCVVMLLGTTFAWFTDSASTGVNKIQAGTLDIALEMKNAAGAWESAEGQTLKFTDVNGGENILWEPGCTFKLPAVKIINKGNLALKYKVIISATSGDTKLAEVLDVYLNGADTNNTLKEALTSTDPDGFAHGNLRANSETNELVIALHMQESAGNDYQNLAIQGLAITVVATQDTVEYDSNNNQYDATAEYPEVITNNEEAQNAIMSNGVSTAGDVNVVTSSDITLDLNANGGYYDATLGGTDSENVTIDAKGNKITFASNNRNAINCYGKLTISNAELDSTYKTEGSTWDDYALIFKYHENGANEVVFNNVTFDRQVAIEKGVKATFNNCTINQTANTGDMYALWIQAGADVTLNDCTINSINPNEGSKNRAIKIADEYVAAPTLTKLSVSGTTFSSQKKAAVLVTSTAGANIVWDAGNNISRVAADTVNAVWNDADRTGAWDLVTVNGCTKLQER